MGQVAREEAMMAVSVSNEETRLGLFLGGELRGSWACVTRAPSTEDELGWLAASFLEARRLPQPGAAILCSVVPSLTGVWARALGALSGGRPLVVGPGLKSGLPMAYKDPGQAGADRVVCTVAARELFGAPAIVADFGAMTTFSVVNGEGAFAGGAIAPGIGIAMGALHEEAAQLTEVSLSVPKAAIGRTTAEAIRSGVVLGEAVRADGLVRLMEEELGGPAVLVATGRYGELACAASGRDFAYREDLGLQGLRLIWERNRR